MILFEAGGSEIGPGLRISVDSHPGISVITTH